MQEEWRQLPDYTEYYVSNLGRVKSVKFIAQHNRIREHIMTLDIKKNGYVQVHFRQIGLPNKQASVHRLVAKAFLSDYSDYLQINHIDENKQNNKVSNLEMCTAEYNNNYGNHLNNISKIVLQYTLEGEFIKEWKSTREIERTLGINHKKIVNACRGFIKCKSKITPVSNKSCGYIWKYK